MSRFGKREFILDLPDPEDKKHMQITNYGRLKYLFFTMMVVALILSVIGMRDISLTPYSGYQVSADYKVVRIAPNSPAALAGMKAGDSIVEIGGIPTERLYQLSRLARPKIGEHQRIAVLRDLNWHEFVVTMSPLATKDLFLAWAGNFMALVMLILGFAVQWRRPNKATTLFFLSNFCLALAFMTPPYFETLILRKIVALNFLLFLTLGLAFFLHLTVLFPKPKPAVVETPVEFLIYLPVPLMGIFYLSLRLFQPWADLTLNHFLHYAFGLSVLYCLALALAAVIHSHWTATPSERSHGLNLLMLGLLVGILPPASKVLGDTFLPQVGLPGRDYYQLLVILVTLTFGWALWKASPEEELGGLKHAA